MDTPTEHIRRCAEPGCDVVMRRDTRKYCDLHKALRRGEFERARDLGWQGEAQRGERWGNPKVEHPEPKVVYDRPADECPKRAAFIDAVVARLKARKWGR